MQFAGLNHFAIVLAAVASFMFGWLWYGVLLPRQWVDAVGKTEEEIKGAGGPSPLPFVIAFIAQLIMAWVLAGVIGHLGPGEVTLRNGIISAAFVWLGFVITTLTINNAFQRARWALTLIDGGHWLGVLLLQGAVIGLMGV
ncbi:MAG TPA: DUF1761 domain-containing protein [Hyphomicrobium sp.]